MQDLGLPPASLLDESDAPQEGAFAGVSQNPAIDGRRPRRGKKTWRFAGVFHEDLVLGVAIVDLGYLGMTFVYVAEGNRVLECTWKTPGALGMHVGPPDGTSVAMAPRRLVTLATTRTGGVTVAVDLPGIRANLDIAGEVTPLTVVSDWSRGAGGQAMTVKKAGLVAQGNLSVQGRSYAFADASACLDFTAGFLPRRMVWNWAIAGGRASDGRGVGFNLARGVHDVAQQRFTENALWIDGTPAALPAVTFSPAAGLVPWTIRSADGAVDLVFTPRGQRAENVNLGFVSSRYRQPFGSFTGQLRDARGRTVRIAAMPGVTEDHGAVW